MTPVAASPSARRFACAVLITVAVGSAAGRVLSTQRVFEPNLHLPPGEPYDETRPKRPWPKERPEPPMPTFSSNDRSRWATVRSLVDDGTYVVGRRLPAEVIVLADPDPLSVAARLQAALTVRLQAAEKSGISPNLGIGPDLGIVFEPGWGTVDKVLDPDRLVYYSSKPPLLSTMVAGEYWVLKKTFGWTLKDQPQEVVRTVLLTINVLPLAAYLWLLARLLERHGASDWATIFLVGVAAFGTLVTPFLITFNNHSLAAFSVLIALYAVLRIMQGSDLPQFYAVAGIFTGFAVTNELPAAAFAAGLLAMVLWQSPRRALLWFVPAAVLPVAALMGTNYLAMGSWFDLAYSKFGSVWYEYEGSHWLNVARKLRHSIDWAWRFEERPMYAVNLLFGHRGVFVLTPVFLLMLPSLVLGMSPAAPFSGLTMARTSLGLSGAGAKTDPTRTLSLPRFLFPFTLAVSVVVIGYYVILAPSRNYGGMSCGPRWLMWLTPLWLVAALPTVEWLGRSRWGRGVALTLLGLSVLSASYPAWNPWTHPWIYNFLDSHGWMEY
jgi:hypothetical protein